jgi:hypothetical protein
MKAHYYCGTNIGAYNFTILPLLDEALLKQHISFFKIMMMPNVVLW